MAASRAVRIITDVAAVDRAFDYLVTESTARVALGDRVRVDFNHRSVRGWVIDEVEAQGDLKPLGKWLGYGPAPSVLELARWASVRWCGPVSRFLLAGSPSRLVTSLPDAPTADLLAAQVSAGLVAHEPGVWQVAPTYDPLPFVLAAYEHCRERDGSLLVLVPTESWARRLRGRLEQRGCAVASGEHEWDRMRAQWPVIVGARGSALAPTPRVAGAVIIDADDEAYRSEAAPTWDAVTMVRRRCELDDAPWWCTSMMPSPSLLDRASYHEGADLVGGWPRVDVVDQRSRDPRDGALSREALDAAHRALAGDEAVAVAVVLQRLGTGRLLACRRCGELARCAVCTQPEEEVDGQLRCAQGHGVRANFCLACGATNLRRVRVGVSTLARDVAAQLAQPVSELTAQSSGDDLHRVVVGTEAIWQRVRRCALVIFMDFDQYLLAPRDSARRAAVTAVGKAGRLVGSRREGRGHVVLQTRRGDDPVTLALTSGEFADLVREDVETARLLSLAPYGATARVSGPGAAAFLEGLRRSDVTVHPAPDGFSVRAAQVTTLSEALGELTRPNEKVRVAVE